MTTLVAALLLIACAAPGGAATDTPSDAPVAAWWYDIEFAPSSTTITGVPIDRFNPSWTQASALDDALLHGRIPEMAIAHYAESGFSFRLHSQLDKAKGGEEVFVGVFETGSGSNGRFLAITRDGALVQHFEYPGEAGFSALQANGTDEVRWYSCMECGDYESLRWSGRSYVLE
ncbi:hypothetical protein [Lysobacter sp. A421]